VRRWKGIKNEGMEPWSWQRHTIKGRNLRSKSMSIFSGTSLFKKKLKLGQIFGL